MDTKKGFTLIEVLVAIALFSVIVAIAAGGFVTALRAQREVAALIAAQSNASLALEQVAREVRTGYLFCHDLADNPTCTPLGGAPPGTYANLDFYDAQADHVCYSLAGGALSRNGGGGCGAGVGQAITGANVVVQSLSFVVAGNIEDDHWNPRITITMGVSPQSMDPAIASDTLNLQTTISARVIDCNAIGC